MLQGMVNAKKYKEIIMPSIESITEREQEPIFQDDSASCNRARCVSGFVRLCQCDNFLINFNYSQITDINFEVRNGCGVFRLARKQSKNVCALTSANIRKQKPKSMLELMKTIEKVQSAVV